VQRETGTHVVAWIMGCAPELSQQLREAGVLVTNDTVSAVETLALIAAPAVAAPTRGICRAQTPPGGLNIKVFPWGSRALGAIGKVTSLVYRASALRQKQTSVSADRCLRFRSVASPMMTWTAARRIIYAA